MDFWKYFTPRVVEIVRSPVNGEITVMRDFNTFYLTTGFWTQSGGLIKDLWEPVLKKVHPKSHSYWLILGLSGGTAAGIIAQKYYPAKITGVELDPVMISLGNKYLGLEKIPQLEIIIRDADSYLQTTSFKYDYVLIDMYVGDSPPGFLYEKKFLQQLRCTGKIVIINHLFYSDLHKQNAEILLQKLEPVFPSVTLFRKLTNLMIICEE